MNDIGFSVNVREFVEFLIDSMEEREYFKFEFTKSLSLAIDILINIGEMLNFFESEDMAYLTVDDIIAVYQKSEDIIRHQWQQVIDENRKTFEKIQI